MNIAVGASMSSAGPGFRGWFRSGLIWLVLATSTGVTSLGKSIFDEDTPLPPKPIQPPHSVDVPSVPPATEPSPPDAPRDMPPAILRQDPADVQPPRQSIPARTELTRSRQLLKLAFAEQMKAQTPSARRTLADLLIAESDKPSYSAADRVALLTGAIEAAKDGASLSRCFEAVDKLSHSFAVDDLKLKLNAATSINLRILAAPDMNNVIAGMYVANALAANEQFNDAVRVLGLIRPIAASDATLRTALAKRSQALEADRAAFEKVRQSRETLKTLPRDEAANLAVGRYYCLRLSNWDQGLPFLSLGSDKKLRQLALAEIAGQKNAEKEIAIGDAWWDFAETKGMPAPDATAAKLHAAELYHAGRGAVTGLAVKVVEARLKQVAEIALEADEQTPTVIYTFGDQTALADFDVTGNARIRREGGVELSHGSPSELATRAVFCLPIRAEFEALCLPDGVLDIVPCVFTTGNETNTGFGVALGTDYNRASVALVFGNQVSFPHTPLKANELHRVVLTIDKRGIAKAEVDGKTVFQGVAPKDAKLAGHVVVGGGRGDVVYTRVVIRAAKIAHP